MLLPLRSLKIFLSSSSKWLLASWLGSDQLTTCYKYKAFAQAVQAFDDKKKSQSIDDTGLRLEKGSNLIKKKLKRIVDKACTA